MVLVVVAIAWGLTGGCGTEEGGEGDSSITDDAAADGAADGALEDSGGVGPDGGLADGGAGDAGDAGGPPPMPGYVAVGTPTTHARGRGEPPVVAWPKPVNAHPEVPFEFTMVAYDPDHDRLLYSLRDAPAGMEIDANGTISWTPTANGTTHDFTVEVDDGRGDPVTVPVSLLVDASKFIFVAPGGDDDAAGTIDAPLGDVDAALRVLTATDGGTLFVRGGTYDITWNWERGGVMSPFRGTDGTPDAPYVVRGYPGESPILDCGERGHGIWTYGGSYILHANLEIRGAAAGERGGAIVDGGHSIFQDITVRDSNWPSSQNCTGFLLRGNGATCHRCQAFDNYDRSSGHWNSSNYLVYTDRGDEAVVSIIDSLSGGSVSGFKMKHAGSGRLILHGSREVGSDYGWAGMDDDTTIRFNTFEGNAEGMTVAVTDPNASTRGGMLMENNTVVGATRALALGGSYAADGVTLRANVLTIAGAPGSPEDAPHYTWVRPWDDGPSASILIAENNCYWGPASDTGFRFGRDTGGFTEWQAVGFDASSAFADPIFEDDSYAPGALSECAGAGDRVGAWE